MSMNRERVYRCALALCVVVMGCLVSHVVILDKYGKADASLIAIQEAHITRLRDHIQKTASSSKPSEVVILSAMHRPAMP